MIAVEGFYFFIAAILSIFIYLIFVNVRAIFKARVVKSYIEPVSECEDIGFAMENKVTRELYFNKKIIFVVSVGVNNKGIYVYSPCKLSALIPWKNLAAIRVINLNGSLLANLRVFKDEGIDRKLTVPWKQGFNSEVPASVTLVVDRQPSTSR